MTEHFRGFYLTGNSEPRSDSLLGRVTQWLPTGTIDYIRRDNSVVELMRFRLSAKSFADKGAAEAEWMGWKLPDSRSIVAIATL